MSLNAATIEMLLAKGLSGQDILDVARATEAKADPTNAQRQARFRAKRKAESNAVTVTENGSPYEVSSTPSADLKDEANASSQMRQPIAAAKSAWNENAAQVGWNLIETISPNRAKLLASRLRQHGLEGWKAAIARARASPYLAGADPPAWFTFDWLIKSGNFLKLTEGNYDRQRTSGVAAPPPDPTLAFVRSAVAAQRQDGGDYWEARSAVSPG